jgi:hypothetical protein
MKRYLLLLAAVALAALAFPSLASAQSGHFIEGGGNAPECTDIGTQVSCSGKVAGLGGTTFEITVTATGIANITCANPGQNEDVPGQRKEITATGSSGPLPTPRNGQFVFTDLRTVTPTAPAGSCPNPKWTATVVDVEFTTATLTLFEDGVQSDQVTVPVS